MEVLNHSTEAETLSNTFKQNQNVEEEEATMPMKEWFRKMQPIQLYVILTLTIAFFLTELIVSHLTHALTLLMDSYHMLCNIMALTGCIVTIKYSKESSTKDYDFKKTPSVETTVGEELTTKPTGCQDKTKPHLSLAQASRENKLKNTFGWARVDVIFTLICCVFLASLSFSIFVEALQTLVHIGHHDEMHHPIWVLCLGSTGLLLNGICYLLIGGYTFHQGSFLYVTESGDVILNKVVIDQSVQRGAKRLSRTKTIHVNVSSPRQRQGLWEMTRDVSGCVLVIICALLIFFTDKNTAKYIDPIISLISAGVIMFLSYPYMKESCLILLQTMPDTIDIDSLKAELLNHFPDVVNIHDFHVWQLTTHKIISTVHIIFQNPKVYSKIIDEVKDFFIEKGINQVTIQPEFFTKNASANSLSSNKYAPDCLMTCLGEVCRNSHCCPEYQEKYSSEEIPQVVSKSCDLKSVRILNNADRPENHTPENIQVLNGGASTAHSPKESEIVLPNEQNEVQNTLIPNEHERDDNDTARSSRSDSCDENLQNSAITSNKSVADDGAVHNEKT